MDLLKLINDAISSSHEREFRPYIGASMIGRSCERSIWYDYHGVVADKIPSAIQITFDIGKNLEKLLLDYIERTGLKLERPNENNEFLFVQDSLILDFQGHMDALLLVDGKKVVLEIKTAKSSSFQILKSKGLREWSPLYYAQLQSYMGMSGHHTAVILVLNKDTSEMHLEWIHFDSEYYDRLRHRVKLILDSEEPLPRINSNSCFYLCQKCKFKTVCHY